jgi:hypothetical protein
MNKLLNRYLYAVQSHLSASLTEAQREDIVRELSENLQSQIDDQEAALGRPLDDDDYARLLEAHGHPIAVARRYLPNRLLIGPQLLPYYWFSLKIAMWVAVSIYIGVETIRPFLTGKAPSFSIGGWIGAALALFGVVTLAFTLLEFSQARFGWSARWNPRHLPPVSTYANPRGRYMAEGVWGIVMLVLLGIAAHPSLGGLQVSSIWPGYRQALSATTAAAVLVAGLRLMRPQWGLSLSIASLLARAAGCVVLYQLTLAGDLLVGADPRITTHNLEIANRVVLANLLLFFWIAVLDFCVELWRVIGPLVGKHLHGVPSRA